MKKKPISNKTYTQNERDRLARLGNTSYRPQTTRIHPVGETPGWDWRRRLKVGILSIVTLVMLLVVTIVAWNIRNFSAFSQELFDAESVLEVFPSVPLARDDAGRTNIVILGTASDRPNHGGNGLTDTILLISMDESGDGYMLSLPRDLYVSIPGYGYGRINEVYTIGEQDDFQQAGYVNGGVGLMQKTIQDTIGLRTHYHAVVSFNAVERIVDAFDGITVNIDSPDKRGLYDPNFQGFEGGPLRLENGTQEIDGQTALRLSRARGSAGGYGFPESDFNRTRNQQEVLRALVAEMDWRVALDPRLNQQLFDAVASTTETDVDMNELLSLFRLFRNAAPQDLQSYTLRDIEGQNLLTSYTTPQGGAVLIPRGGLDSFDEVRQAIDAIHQ